MRQPLAPHLDGLRREEKLQSPNTPTAGRAGMVATILERVGRLVGIMCGLSCLSCDPQDSQAAVPTELKLSANGDIAVRYASTYRVKLRP